MPDCSSPTAQQEMYVRAIQRKGNMNSITDVVRPENNLRHREPLVVHVHHLRLFVKRFAWSPDPPRTISREIREDILLHYRVVPRTKANRGSEEVSRAVRGLTYCEASISFLKSVDT